MDEHKFKNWLRHSIPFAESLKMYCIPIPKDLWDIEDQNILRDSFNAMIKPYHSIYHEQTLTRMYQMSEDDWGWDAVSSAFSVVLPLRLQYTVDSLLDKSLITEEILKRIKNEKIS